MDIEKLIEQYMQAADKWGKRHPVTDTFDLRVQDALRDAATALSTLQAENAQLRGELEYEQEHANAYYEECGQWEAENEKLRGYINDLETQHRTEICENGYDCVELGKLRAELEKVKRERDAAVESIPHECKACMYHTVFFNGCTPDHDCTNPDGGCSNNCDRWKWRGQKEE